ncbi:MAG: aldehyde dehydrogenase [Gammaproteobacteria bacterium]|nr:aldehyde dehydrogenase [Gammaproteobacteria bacterium]MDE0365102.1 aldehyde dehydrogenase [Gammaproteobacteria bacterium]
MSEAVPLSADSPRHYIGGQFVDAASGGVFEVVNPATEEAVTTAARGDAADIDRAVRAAKEAFEGGDWSRAKPSFRRSVLFRAADLIEARSAEIMQRQTLEMGGPIGPDLGGRPHPLMVRSAWNLRFFAAEQEQAGDRSFNRDDSLLTYTMTDPAGVFGLITPWNAPIMLSTWKMAPCLAYGNSAVHKPSENSPLSIGILCEIYEEAGLPPGVYNVVLGYGREAGVPLVEHEDVIGISFTGSPATAKDIATRAARGLKRTSFELGGKSANIVFADADLDKAVPAAAMGIFMNSGQVCVAGSRILVQREIYDRFLERFQKAAAGWKPGNPMDRRTRLGPLVSQAQYERVMGYLDLAGEEGRILFGGGRPDGIDRGWFVEPTAIVDVDPGARICQEEIFGPVATIIPFSDPDEAIAIANNSDYGLAGYIWTGSQDTAHYVSHRLQTGMIWINSGFDRDLRQPFGGMKISGLGREGGELSREFYTETRFASFPLTPRGGQSAAAH